MDSPVSSDEFRNACAMLASAVSVATVLATDGIPHGLTVSTFTPVSLVPPLVLICIDNSGATLPHFYESNYFGINVLGDAQQDLSVTFSVKPEGRFEGVRWSAGTGGTPILDGALAWFCCLKERLVKAGDHVIVIGEVVACGKKSGLPLLYFNRTYRALDVSRS